VVVAATNLPAGQVLQRDSLKLDRMEADKVSKAHYVENQGLEGQELLRAVRAGEPIRVSDLRPATLIKRGEMVLMTVGTPATFEISVKAEAMQDQAEEYRVGPDVVGGCHRQRHGQRLVMLNREQNIFFRGAKVLSSASDTCCDRSKRPLAESEKTL
jgi:flagella basal body P-ring formation protein FlgA